MEDNKQRSLNIPLKNNKNDKEKGYDYDIYSKSNFISKVFVYWALKILKVNAYLYSNNT